MPWLAYADEAAALADPEGVNPGARIRWLKG